MKRDEEKHIVIENHHQPIIDYRAPLPPPVFSGRSVPPPIAGAWKKYDNVYSGFLFCGDCGSPMFAMSRRDLSAAYTCGTYHWGRSGCSSHHIRVDKLDELLKNHVRRVAGAFPRHAGRTEHRTGTDSDVVETEQSADHLPRSLEELREELKATKRQRIRTTVKHPNQEELLAETYDELGSRPAKKRGAGCGSVLTRSQANTIIQAGACRQNRHGGIRDILSRKRWNETI